MLQRHPYSNVVQVQAELEVEALQGEADMPLEQLLALYGYGKDPNSPANPDEPSPPLADLAPADASTSAPTPPRNPVEANQAQEGAAGNGGVVSRLEAAAPTHDEVSLCSDQIPGTLQPVPENTTHK